MSAMLQDYEGDEVIRLPEGRHLRVAVEVDAAPTPKPGGSWVTVYVSLVEPGKAGRSPMTTSEERFQYWVDALPASPPPEGA